MELAFRSRISGSPLCPSIVARNIATLLTADLHPIGGPEIWQGNHIFKKFLYMNPRPDGRGWVPLGHPTVSPTLVPLAKVGSPMGKRFPQSVPSIGPSTRRPPLLSRLEGIYLGQCSHALFSPAESYPRPQVSQSDVGLHDHCPLAKSKERYILASLRR
jgi:hypothetical protein